jgi:hypothetical protein
MNKVKKFITRGICKKTNSFVYGYYIKGWIGGDEPLTTKDTHFILTKPINPHNTHNGSVFIEIIKEPDMFLGAIDFYGKDLFESDDIKTKSGSVFKNITLEDWHRLNSIVFEIIGNTHNIKEENE